ncbi:hypothetical protein TNCV_1825271 [Trichonephila clavipes]|nr:hypothetical protein TNCV_1825271 [Trichonephila clavipes]
MFSNRREEGKEAELLNAVLLRASTKVFKKRRGVFFYKGRCKKINDGCVESNSTVPKNSADEKNCADGAKLCTNETEPSASYSGKMEVAGALYIFQRPQSLYNVRYTKYLGDGDSKAFTSIVDNNVCGDNCSVEKL